MKKIILLPIGFLLACGPGPVEKKVVADSDDDLPTFATREAVFKGAPDNKSIRRTDKADDVLPARSDELLKFQSPVRNQGQRGTCTIFSSTALMEHLYIKA